MNPTHPTASAPNLVVRYDATPTPEAAATLLALHQAVAQALDRKRRLGQYAVVWQDGRVVRLAPEALPLMP
jgi:hypothetical protein